MAAEIWAAHHSMHHHLEHSVLTSLCTFCQAAIKEKADSKASLSVIACTCMSDRELLWQERLYCWWVWGTQFFCNPIVFLLAKAAVQGGDLSLIVIVESPTCVTGTKVIETRFNCTDQVRLRWRHSQLHMQLQRAPHVSLKPKL